LSTGFTEITREIPRASSYGGDVRAVLHHLALTLVLAACGEQFEAGSAASATTEGDVVVGAYSTPQTAFDASSRKFQRHRKVPNVKFTESYGARRPEAAPCSADFGRRIVDFSLEPDMTSSVKPRIATANMEHCPTKAS